MADKPEIPSRYRPVFHRGFNAHVGPILGDFSGPDLGPHHFLFDVEPHHLNSADMIHGGMLMSLADVVLGSTVAKAAGGMGATISLNCDFIASAKAGTRIEGEATITRMTRSVAFVSGRLYAGDKTFLTASGIWKVFPKPEDAATFSPTDFDAAGDLPAKPETVTPPEGLIDLPLEDPFEAHLGPFFITPRYRETDFEGGGTLGVSLHIDERHVNGRGVCHGGTLMTLADAILGMAAWVTADKPTVTLAMQSNFLRPCNLGDWVTAKPRLTRKTRSIIFVEIDLDVGDQTVFSASSLWKVLGN